MRRYQLGAPEHVHMMRHVPRSYDMTRTHVMHKGVNKRVDVVLRCSPKNWKKKKVQVSIVRGEKKTDIAKIRAHAKKGYVAVRKASDPRFEADRKAAATAYETKYGAPSAANNALIHDMKNQLSFMARKSADYIEEQLAAKPVQAAAAVEMPQTPPPQEETAKPLLSSETEEILRKGGYRRPTSLSSRNPYASNYSAQASNEEFHTLMASLEKSLDEAYSKYVTEPPKQEDTLTHDDFGGTSYAVPDSQTVSAYQQTSDISLSVTPYQKIVVDPQPRFDEPHVEEHFEPALNFADGGEHYLREDELFDRELHKPVSEDASHDFTLPAVREEEEFVPMPTFPPEEEEEFVPMPTFPPEEEEEFVPMPTYPADDGGYSPAPVSPDRNEYYDGDVPVSERSNETLFSRTGDQIKKVIGIIRGGMNHARGDDVEDHPVNDNLEITYSDRD